MQQLTAHGFGKVVQVAHVVEDVDLAMQRWLRLMGLGPWTCLRNIELDATLDGRSVRMRLHEANAYIGDLQIQLIQSLNRPDEITPYHDFIQAGHWGMHHIAFLSQDAQADAARAKEQGFNRQCEMRDPQGFRHYYCQSPEMPNFWIEFLQSNPGVDGLFAGGIAEAAQWDGSGERIHNIDVSALKLE